MSGAEANGERSLLERAADYMLNASVQQRLLIAVMSTVLAMLIGLLVVAITGHNPVFFANDMIVGAFGSVRAITRTLRLATLFILAGVAVAIAFRAGVFNIGVQGQIIFGGLACAVSIIWLAPFLPENAIGGAILIVVGLVASIIAGGLYGALPGVLKAYADANEIITTIMLNFIAIGIVGYLVTGPLQAEGGTQRRTDSIPDYVSFPFTTYDFSIVGFAITIGVVALVAYVMTRTSFGYDMVTSGYQASAATYSGVDARRTIVATMTFSGMVAGLTGAIYVIMIQGYFIDPGSGFGNYGFDAIAVSLLAANNPIGVIPAGLLFGGLDSASSHISLHSDVPDQLVDGIVGLVVLFVAAPELFRLVAERMNIGGEQR